MKPNGGIVCNLMLPNSLHATAAAKSHFLSIMHSVFNLDIVANRPEQTV